MKSLKSKNILLRISFENVVLKYGRAIQKKLICTDQSRFYIFSHPLLAFLTINHMQAESRILLDVIPVCIIVPHG